TWSRGATIAALIVTTVAVLRYAARFSISRTKAGALFGVLAVAGVLTSPALIRKFSDRGESDPYNYMRPKVWLGALHMVRDNPLFGVGLGQFFHVSRRYAPALEGGVARYLKRPAIADSAYLAYAAETGLPAILLMMALSGSLVCLAVRRTYTCPPETRASQEAAVLVSIGLATHALVDNNWVVPVMAAGLVVFALADVLPYRDRTIDIRWTP